MKKVLLIIYLMVSFNTINSQVLKLGVGVSSSSFYHKNIDILNEGIKSPSYSLGFDFFQQKYFEISTEITYWEKGGKEKNHPIINKNEEISFLDIEESFKYVNLNTTLRFKYPLYSNYFYLGFGPKLDILLSNNRLINYDYLLSKFLFGFKPEIGFTQKLSEKINVGLNFSYLWNIGKVGKSDYTYLQNNNYRLLFNVGYALK